VIDPEGRAVTYGYDTADRIVRIRNRRGQLVAENTYDAHGQVALQVAEGDPSQAWEYAFTGSLNAEINPAREFLRYGFNRRGRTTRVLNGNGDLTRMAYDGQNQIIRLTDPEGNITRFVYDGRNNLSFTYDARNGATGTALAIERQYDGNDRLTRIIDESGNTTTFTYDSQNHLVKITDPLLRETVFTYFSSGPHDGLLATVSTPGASPGQTDITTTTPDAFGYPATLTRPDGSVVTRTFNARGDLLTSAIQTSGDPNTHAVTHTWDRNRRRLASTDALGFGETRLHDPDGNLVLHTDRFGNATTASYSPLGRRLSVTGPDGNTTWFDLDTAGRRHRISRPARS